jgi:hypothetical protein
MRETHTVTFVAMENVVVCTRRGRVGVGDVGLYVENCKPSTLRSVHNLIGLVDSVRLHDSECLCEGGHIAMCEKFKAEKLQYSGQNQES